MYARLTLLTLTMIVAGACGDDKNQSTSGASATDSGSSTGGASDPTSASDPTDATDGTIGMSSEPTTDAVTGGMTSTTTGVMMTTDGETMVLTTDPVETTGASTTEPQETTGGVDPETMAACEKVCELMVECMLMPDLESCTAECSDGSAGDTPMCQKAKQEVLACATELTCEQLGALLNDSDPGPCLDPILAQMKACDGGVGECSAGGGGNMEGTECDFTLDCTGEPLRAMQCNTKTCTCLEDGMKVGMCPAEAICMAQEDIQAKATECCGF